MCHSGPALPRCLCWHCVCVCAKCFESEFFASDKKYKIIIVCLYRHITCLWEQSCWEIRNTEASSLQLWLTHPSSTRGTPKCMWNVCVHATVYVLYIRIWDLQLFPEAIAVNKFVFFSEFLCSERDDSVWDIVIYSGLQPHGYTVEMPCLRYSESKYLLSYRDTHTPLLDNRGL